jgi:glutaredoxin
MGESAPDWQCPSCGVAYAKAGASVEARPRSASGGGGMLLKLLVVVALAGAAWVVAQGLRPGSKSADQGELAKTGVVMYSLTTCGFCNQKRNALNAAGIPFVEYFVDKEPERNQELFAKLRAAGHFGGVGTPTFEVNGRMLPNNPSLETISKHL